MSTINKLLDRLGIEVIDYSKEQDEMLEQLPITGHSDRFDRMIISCAMALDAPLIGGDQEFESYKSLRAIWS